MGKSEELLNLVPSMTKRAYKSIETIYEEILSEGYWRIEYDSMRAKDPYTCTVIPRGLTKEALKIVTLENLVNRVKELKVFRKEV